MMSCTVLDGGCVRINGIWGFNAPVKLGGVLVSPLDSPWSATMTIYDRIGGNILIPSVAVAIDDTNSYFILILDETQLAILGEGTFICELLVVNPVLTDDRGRFPIAIKFEVTK